MLTSIIIIIIITKEEIKNSKRESVIYTIPTASKYGILPKLKKLRDVCLIILFFA